MSFDLTPAQSSAQAWLEQSWETLSLQVPRQVNADRFKRILIDQVRNNPSIAKCDPQSIFRSCVKAANLGLEVGMLNSAWLIPYNGVCTLVPGYGGLIQLARRSGEVSAVNVVEVRANDRVEQYADGTIDHRANPFDKNRGEVVGVIVCVTMTDGSRQWTTTSLEEYHAVRPHGWDKPTSPHVRFPREMLKKTGIRRALKTVPLTPEVSEVLQDADRAEYDDTATVEVKGRGTQAVKEMLVARSVADLVDEEDDQDEVAEPKTRAPRRDWASDLDHANRLIQLMGSTIPVWDKMTETRKQLIRRRMAAENINDHDEFWGRALAILTPFDSEKIESWSSKSLELFLRVPQRGTPDHWQLAAEGHYRPNGKHADEEGDGGEDRYDPLA